MLPRRASPSSPFRENRAHPIFQTGSKLWAWGNWPASYHNRAGTLVFADGHAEGRRWVDARTTPSRGRANPITVANSLPSPGNRDIEWLAMRTTGKR